MTSFTLDKMIADTSWSVGMCGIFEVRLVDDSRFLWLLLIPHKPNLHEWYELETTEQQQLIALASHISAIISDKVQADKMNVATIGNIVPQMHLHIVARHKHDMAWPAPVWGHGTSVPYQDKLAQETQMAIQDWLGDLLD